MRGGTTNLYAALDVASGHVIADMTERHRAEEFRQFLNLINRSVPEHLDVHLVVDNVSTHKTPEIKRWLLRHPRFHLHFTPTYSSWINLIERWFAELTTKWLTRGTHRSTKELEASITAGSRIGTKTPSPSSGTRAPTRSSTRSPATASGSPTQVTSDPRPQPAQMGGKGPRRGDDVAEFDGADEEPASNVRYVGPVLPTRNPAEEWLSPWEPTDLRPLVLVSLSTMPGQASTTLAQGVLDALAQNAIRVVMTTGALSPEKLTPPGNAVVFGVLPHGAILPQAALMVTHGGHGSVMGALAHGVPLVCIPGVGADQPIVGERIVVVGAGRWSLLMHSGSLATLSRRSCQIPRTVRKPGTCEC